MNIFINQAHVQLLAPEALPTEPHEHIIDLQAVPANTALQTHTWVKNADAKYLHQTLLWLMHQQMPHIRFVAFSVDDLEEIKNSLKQSFQVIEAGGGLVLKKNKILLISRLGKWDLPKGKIDKGEDEKMAAVREVEEECGIKAKILYKIGNTWHTYIQADKSHKLKKTVWFVMQCLEDKNLQPQEDEGITKVKWTKPHGIEKKLANSYASILHVYRKFERKLQKKAMQNLTTAVEETV